MAVKDMDRPEIAPRSVLGKDGELPRWLSGQLAAAPCRDQMVRVVRALEHVLIQALVAGSAIEALHDAILHRFAGRDLVPLNTAILPPLEHAV